MSTLKPPKYPTRNVNKQYDHPKLPTTPAEISMKNSVDKTGSGEVRSSSLTKLVSLNHLI